MVLSRGRPGLAAVFAAILAAPAAADEAAIRLEAPPEGAPWTEVVAVGLAPQTLSTLAGSQPATEEWEAVLSVRTGAGPAAAARPAVIGTWRVTAGAVRFRPRFPWTPGLEYTAFFADIHRTFTLEGPPPATTSVEAIFPSTDSLPANLLRFYIHFSGPIRDRDTHLRVRLVDDDGRDVPEAFVEIPSGLWDPDRRRLTVLVHPGRVKTGVGPRRALGPVLVAGREYRLVVDRELRDASGTPLAAAAEKRFTVVGEDRRRPDPTRWRLHPPADAEAPLVVTLDEPLDRALLRRLVRVETATGDRLAGETSVTEGETVWSFVPERGWPAGPCELVVDPAIEDLAGNTVDRLFEDEAPAGSMARGAPIRRAFRVGQPATPPAPRRPAPIR